MGVMLTNFHRTLSTYCNGCIGAGFRIDGIIEPTVSETALAEHLELDDERRVPNFIIFILRKV